MAGSETAPEGPEPAIPLYRGTSSRAEEKSRLAGIFACFEPLCRERGLKLRIIPAERELDFPVSECVRPPTFFTEPSEMLRGSYHAADTEPRTETLSFLRRNR